MAIVRVLDDRLKAEEKSFVYFDSNFTWNQSHSIVFVKLIYYNVPNNLTKQFIHWFEFGEYLAVFVLISIAVCSIFTTTPSFLFNLFAFNYISRTIHSMKEIS